MTNAREEEIVTQCFREVAGAAPTSVTTLRPHASERRMYRLTLGGTSLIGVYNESRPENDTFVWLARHFKSLSLPVPQIHAYKPEQGVYLEDDLGDTTLLDLLESSRAEAGTPFPAPAMDAYIRSIEFLPRFQIEAATTLDFSKCQASPGTFSAALRRDLDSFLKDFLTRLMPSFDTTATRGDLQALMAALSQGTSPFFLYRDFQSRNIMLVSGSPFFIDFQSGMPGPLQYDVASMLFQSSARLPDSARAELLERYLGAAEQLGFADRAGFLRLYPCFIVARMLGVLGVYGRQGLVAKKEYFARSIPAALATLLKQLESPELAIKLDGLHDCAKALLEAHARQADPTS